MQRTTSFLLLVILLPFGALAQSRLLTIDEATNMNPKLSPSNLSQLQWRPGTREYVFVAKNCLVQGSAASISRDTILRLQEINLLLKINKQDTLKRFPSITFRTSDEFNFANGSKLFLFDFLKKIVTVKNTWAEKTENLDIDKTTEFVAYTKDNNLYISMDGKETAISGEKNPGIVYGSGRVHRNEFGIEKGTFWSPKGHYLAFYRIDETMVADYPLVDITTRIATVNPTKYPMAGMISHKVTVGVYSIANGQTVYLQTDSSGITDPVSSIEYLTNITWSPDEHYIFIACLNRDQNFMQMNKYDASTGKFINTLFEEKNQTYVEPLHGPEFLNGDSEKFIWQSRRD